MWPGVRPAVFGEISSGKKYGGKTPVARAPVARAPVARCPAVKWVDTVAYTFPLTLKYVDIIMCLAAYPNMFEPKS